MVFLRLLQHLLLCMYNRERGKILFFELSLDSTTQEIASQAINRYDVFLMLAIDMVRN